MRPFFHPIRTPSPITTTIARSTRFMTPRHCAPLPCGTQRTGCFLRKPVVKGESHPECREVSAITNRHGRVGHRSDRDPREASADTYPACPSGNEVSERETGDGEHVHRLRNRLAYSPDLLHGPHSGPIQA